MIYVTAGHENGIGLEVFLKSYLLLQPKDQDKFFLITNRQVLAQTLGNCNLSLENDPLRLAYIYDEPFSTSALSKALSMCKEEDILLTMPTDPEELVINNKSVSGHTKFFKEYFETDIAMFFKAENFNVLLASDHIPLKDVPNITAQQIHDKVNICLKSYENYFGKIKKVVVSGINPHRGNKGFLGDEDKKVEEAIYTLSKEHNQTFVGPLPADSLLISNEINSETLFVYLHHDQGLGAFKALYKTNGSNISFGLPFLRLSVHHGTAPELYGKNVADYMGCYQVLRMSLSAHKRISNNEETK